MCKAFLGMTNAMGNCEATGRWNRAVGLLAFLVLAGTGCGARAPATGELTGKVTLGGKPVVIGTLSVISQGGRAESCSISNGAYLLPRAPVGHVTVAITGATYEPPPESFEQHKQKMMEQARKPKRDGKEEKEEKEPEDPGKVPTKYMNPQTSGLTVEVKPGYQVHDFELP